MTPIHRDLATVSLVTILVAGAAPHAHGFSLFPDQPDATVREAIDAAARWPVEPDPLGFHNGLRNGLRVAVESDFATKLGAASNNERAAIAAVVRNAFAAWQTPELRFHIDPSRIPVEGIGAPELGYDMDLFAVPETHPAFGGRSLFGIAHVQWVSPVEYVQTNGQRNTGLITLKSDIFVNTTLFAALAGQLSPHQQLLALQRLLIHEIGHALGFGHPNALADLNAHFDTDLDPYNVMRLDPRDPALHLIISPNRPSDAVMTDAAEFGPSLLFTELQADDRGGRDALYPSLTRCPGDCDGNTEVNVAEILTAVSIALGDVHVDHCFRADQDEDGGIQVDELLRAVNAALVGCAPSELWATLPPVPRAAGRISGLRTGASIIHCGDGTHVH